MTFDPKHGLLFMEEGSFIVGKDLSGPEVVRFDLGDNISTLSRFYYLPEKDRLLLSTSPFINFSLKRDGGPNLHTEHPLHLSFALQRGASSHNIQFGEGTLLKEDLPREELNLSKEDYGAVNHRRVAYEDFYKISNSLAQPAASSIYVQPELDRLILPYSMGTEMDARSRVFLRSADGLKDHGSVSFGRIAYTSKISPNGRYLAICLGGGASLKQLFAEPFATFVGPSVLLFDLMHPEQPLVALEAENAVYNIAWVSNTELRMADNGGNIYAYKIP